MTDYIKSKFAKPFKRRLLKGIDSVWCPHNGKGDGLFIEIKDLNIREERLRTVYSCKGCSYNLLIIEKGRRDET